MKSTEHQYEALPGGRWFRLLLIEPGVAGDPIRCNLVTADLDTNPSYKALSYVWGDPTILGEIICNGSSRPVTISLLEGLVRLRKADRMESVWADAICINQDDQEEKAHQVNMMGAIYDQAAEVVVWLGRDSDDLAQTAFDGLSAVNEAIIRRTHVVQSVVPDSSMVLTNAGGEKSAPIPINQRRSRLPEILQPQHVRAIMELFQLKWFTRVWVLQEVGLASGAQAFWGDSSINFNEIGKFILFAMIEKDMDLVLDQNAKDIISGSPYYAFWNIWLTYGKKTSWVAQCPPLKWYSDYQASECRIDFLLVLEASRRFDATNPLDHVFAFLGHPKALVPSTNEPLVKADYKMNLDDLHLIVTQRLAEQSLNFLVQVQNQAASLEPNCTSPSWVPRWDANHSDAPTAFWEAWDASLRSTRPSFKSQISGRRLSVSAILFDSISCHTDKMNRSDFDRSADGPGNLVEQCWRLTEQAATAKPHVYGEDVVMAFILTIICHHKSKSADSSEYQDLLTLFVRFCALYNGDFWKEKLEKYGVWYGSTPLLAERQLLIQFQEYGTNRKFFVSEGGYWGLGPGLMQRGDVCAVLPGADVPFVLRPTGEKGHYKLVGQAYMHGVMYGEVVERVENGGSDWAKEDIFLV